MAIAEDYNFETLNIISGNLEVRLAENSLEIDAAQALRYKVFFEEMQAIPSTKQKKSKRDIDEFDHYFDHLLVVDHNKPGKVHEKVVGTYRLNGGNHKGKENFFYTSGEYDLTKLIAIDSNILELGRSCVDLKYRNGKTMQLLWAFIAQYVIKYNIEIMFGCASFPGIEVEKHKSALAYLNKKYLAPAYIRPVAVKSRYIKMKNDELISGSNFKKFISSIPPLIKGYIRLGAFVGDGAVIDYDFNTIDICIVLPTKKVAARYMDHFDRK